MLQHCGVIITLMISFRNNHYGMWPASGEIDLLESRGLYKLYLVSEIQVITFKVSS